MVACALDINDNNKKNDDKGGYLKKGEKDKWDHVLKDGVHKEKV